MSRRVHSMLPLDAALLGITLVSALASCAGASVNQAIDPLEGAIAQSRIALDEALEAAHEAEEEVDAMHFQVRYNPVECDCPQWEAVYRGDWLRVYLDAEPAAVRRLQELREQAAADLDAGELATYTELGRLGRELTLAETGMRYRTLWLVPD